MRDVMVNRKVDLARTTLEEAHKSVSNSLILGIAKKVKSLYHIHNERMTQRVRLDTIKMFNIRLT